MATNLQQQVWGWVKTLCKGSLGGYKPEMGISLGAYDAAWAVSRAVSEADMRRKIGVADVQAIIEKQLARQRKAYANFLKELELQDSYNDPSSNEERRLEYIKECFRKPEGKGDSSWASYNDRSTDIPMMGDYVPPEPWWYFFPRELEGNYEGLLAWANEYYAQAIETLERMKAEVWT